MSGLYFEGIAETYRDEVDILHYQPGGVIPKPEGKSKLGSNVITTERAAEVALRDLGLETWSCGDFKHDYQFYFKKYLPKFLQKFYANKLKDEATERLKLK